MNVRLISTILVLGISVTSIPLASAAERGGYFGISVGETDAGLSVSDFNDGGVTSGSVDDSDTGWKLFGGFRFSENLAIEGGLFNLGEVTFDGVSNGTGILFAAGPVSLDTEVDGLFVAVVGTIRFNKVGLFGKGGLHMWDADLDLVDSDGSFSASDDETDPMYGIGVEFEASDKIAVRGAFEVFTDILDQDVDLLSIGVLISP